MIFSYTEEFDYECSDCGYCDKSASPVNCCSACGSDTVTIKAEALEPLRNFVSVTMVELPDLDIWVAKVPVTQIVWRLITGRNPSRFRGDELPVESINQQDCFSFVSLMNKHPIVQKSGFVFRLPTSDEWSLFAKRGRRKFSNIAWSWNDNVSTPQPVAAKKTNPLGLYDLWGNVWEWCSDIDGDYAVCRGGCWCCDEAGCKKVETLPNDSRCSFVGCRLCAKRIL